MNRGLLFLLLATSTSQVLAQDAPIETGTGLPTTTLVLPPQVPPRPPLIAIPNNELVPIQLNSPQKESLAWRACAHRLRSSNSAQQQTLASTYDAAVMNLISALSASGLRVQTLNSKAGELLAVPTDGRSAQKYVFVVSEMPPGTVTIKGTTLLPTKQQNVILNSIFETLAGRQFASGERSTR
jgi:hypothetical protein